MEKAGQLPGVRSGNRFMVNVDLLVAELQRASAVGDKHDADR